MGAPKLLADVRKKIRENEYNLVTLKGKKLSRADLEQLELYAEKFIDTGSFNGLMTPHGAIKHVLDAYGLDTTTNGFTW